MPSDGAGCGSTRAPDDAIVAPSINGVVGSSLYIVTALLRKRSGVSSVGQLVGRWEETKIYSLVQRGAPVILRSHLCAIACTMLR